MTLYGRSRDISLFRSLNRELVNEIIDTRVDVIKPEVQQMNDNIYGESTHKVWSVPVRLHCMISINEQGVNYDEFGPDVTQTGRFAFLRDDLVVADIVIEVGDIIHWNNRYWEIDKEVENQYFMKRNPITADKEPDDPGWILDQDPSVRGTDATWDDDSQPFLDDTDIWMDNEEFYGWNVSVVFEAHETRKVRIQFDDLNSGRSE